jgi:hypothetical protein
MCANSSISTPRRSARTAFTRVQLVSEHVVEDAVDVEVDRQPHQLTDKSRRRHKSFGAMGKIR